ncbi:MAG: thiamine diphosphokinase, partial [Thermoguttaceae bacterium]|nr:thiamine diphosphokinase [Thermoguttaceae bacterium]
MTTNKTVILADGDFPTSPAALKIFEEAEYLCCCDGATAKALAADRIPDAIVGDLDSLSPELRERFADRTHQITEQETNDLSKAFYYCASIERFDVDILGAVGRREDHMLGN